MLAIWLGVLLAGCSPYVDQVLPTAAPSSTNTPPPTASFTPSAPPPTNTLNPALVPVVTATPVLVQPSVVFTTPSATAIIPGTLRIDYFVTDVQVVNPGDSLTLYWAVQGVEGANIFRVEATGERSQQWRVGRTGSLQVPTKTTDTGSVQFVLVAGDATTFVEQTITVALSCANALFFEPGSPDCPPGTSVSSVAAQQTFERGLMIWVQTEARIYVFFDDGKRPAWAIYADEFKDGMPETDAALSPPPGLLQPIRGFGLVWRSNTEVRDRLGWAVNSEAGFTTEMQGDATVEGGVAYIKTADNDVLKLDAQGTGWSRFTPQVNATATVSPLTPSN